MGRRPGREGRALVPRGPCDGRTGWKRRGHVGPWRQTDLEARSSGKDDARDAPATAEIQALRAPSGVFRWPFGDLGISNYIRSSCCLVALAELAIMEDMVKGMNTDLFGEAVPFGDPAWYQSYNSPYYNDTHKKLRKEIRDIVDEHLIDNMHEWDEAGKIPE